MARKEESDWEAARLAEVESKIDDMLDPRGRPWEDIPIDLLRHRALTVPGTIGRAYNILASEAERGAADGGAVRGGARSRSGYIARLPQGVTWPDIAKLLLEREELRGQAPARPVAVHSALPPAASVDVTVDGARIDLEAADARIMSSALLGMLSALVAPGSREIVITVTLH